MPEKKTEEVVPEGSVLIESVRNLEGFDPFADIPEVATWRTVAADIAPAPPKAGKGSSRDDWAAHAQVVGVPVAEDATREDIIAAVETTKES